MQTTPTEASASSVNRQTRPSGELDLPEIAHSLKEVGSGLHRAQAFIVVKCDEESIHYAPARVHALVAESKWATMVLSTHSSDLLGPNMAYVLKIQTEGDSRDCVSGRFEMALRDIAVRLVGVYGASVVVGLTERQALRLAVVKTIPSYTTGSDSRISTVPIHDTSQRITDRPLAAKGLISYRCKNPYGWTMIGAFSDADALNEARRSANNASIDKLQRWNGSEYVPCHVASNEQDSEQSSARLSP